MTLFDQFMTTCRKYNRKTAIWCDGEQKTYAEFGELVCRYANYLSERDVKKGDVIGIPMNNSIESVALIFSAAAIGAVLAPINPTLPIDAIKKAFDVSEVKHIIARKSFFRLVGSEYIDSVRGLKMCLDSHFDNVDSFDDVLNASDRMPDIGDISGEEPLILTMTSGSTGTPKPIVLTQQNKIMRADAHIKMYSLTEKDNVLAATPLYHSLAERLVIMPLLLGGTSVVLPRFTPLLWLNCVKDQRVTFTIAVSSQLAQIAQYLSSPFVPEISSLRCIVSSSALLETHVRNELINKLECEFHEMYGTSECSTVTDICFSQTLNKKESVGCPLPGVSIRLLNDKGEVVPNGEVGEITVNTPLRCAGYYRMPEMLKKAMTEDGYFRTGDLGKMDDDGYLYFCGRKKEIIITGGVNVYPKDVEEKVVSMDSVRECAAFSYADERLGEVVAIAVVVDDKMKITKKKIQLFCARNLADFQQPHKVFIVDELPKNAMGKVLKVKLPEVVAGMEG